MKKYRIIVNITTLYVFIMTFVVSFILSLAQNNDSNLSGEKLLIFLCGFWGSAICIVIRYVILYRNALFQHNLIKKEAPEKNDTFLNIGCFSGAFFLFFLSSAVSASAGFSDNLLS